MLASQSEELAQQELARDTLLASRSQVERDRHDESLAQLSEDQALSAKASELSATLMDTEEALAALSEHKRETQNRLVNLIHDVQSCCVRRVETKVRC